MNSKFKTAVIFIITVIVSLFIINYFSKDRSNTVGGEITIWGDENSYSYINELARDYMKSNKKAKIKVEKVNSKDYFNKIVNLDKKNMPNIAHFNSLEISKLVSKGINLGNEWNLINTYKMNFSNSRLQEININGKISGVPFTSRPLVLYLREDVLNKYGYSSEEINTWDDLIKISEDIYKKSKGKYKGLNGNGQDYKDLLTLLIMQNMECIKDKDKIIKSVNKEIKKLKDKKILTANAYEGYFGKISSIRGMKSIEDLKEKCIWTANNPPAEEIGSNRFFVAQGQNFVVLNSSSDNSNLIDSFLEYISNNSKIALKYAISGDVFPSYIFAYKSKSVEEQINNFKGKSPLVVMSNIAKKAPKIEDYNLYKKIEEQLIS